MSDDGGNDKNQIERGSANRSLAALAIVVHVIRDNGWCTLENPAPKPAQTHICSGGPSVLLTLAIQPDDQLLMSGRRQSFSNRWVELANEQNHEVRIVNIYAKGLFEQLQGCDGFLWWFAHIPRVRQVGMRVALSIEHGLGIPTFPNWQTIWHFDDKVSQKYLLDAAGVPMPDTRVYWNVNDALEYCRKAKYPLVLKLASGICSENVRKVATAEEAEYWVSRMFSTGLTEFEGWPPPSALRKTRRRLGAAARALFAQHSAPNNPRTQLQHGYVLFQEFLPGNDYDTRITVLGERAFAFRRFNRDGDFRASGSGKIDWNPDEITWEKIALAFAVAKKLGTQSLAVDILTRPDGSLLMNEISYYYEGWAVATCPGHWSPDGRWHAGEMAPEDAIFDDFVKWVQAQRRPNMHV